MSTKIEISDLADPVLSEPQRKALAWGESVSVDISEEGILGSAVERAGLSDFGAPDFRERLRILCEAWDGDVGITGLHRTVLHGQLVRYATNRLLIHDTLKRHPEIRDLRITRPVIVAGLPRSGTTHLVNLLASDQRFQSLPLWEAYEPIPLPCEARLPDVADPRYVRCAEAWDSLRTGAPLIAAMHPMEPDHIHEELELMCPDFASYNFEWLNPTPRWRDHYLGTDQTPHYEYMRDVLKILQWRRKDPHRRWVLKCPQHFEQLPVLRKVFPDATVVLTHRDPVAVLQSTVTMQAYTHRVNRRHIDLRTLLEYWSHRIDRLLRACVRDRHVFPESNSVDSLFHVFMADPMKTLGEVYDKAGIEQTSAALDELEKYVKSHPRGRDGQIQYNLERDFDVKPSALYRLYSHYFEHFAVAAEVRDA